MLEPHVQYDLPHAVAHFFLPYILLCAEYGIRALYLAHRPREPQWIRSHVWKLGRRLNAVVQRFQCGRYVANKFFETSDAYVRTVVGAEHLIFVGGLLLAHNARVVDRSVMVWVLSVFVSVETLYFVNQVWGTAGKESCQRYALHVSLISSGKSTPLSEIRHRDISHTPQRCRYGVRTGPRVVVMVGNVVMKVGSDTAGSDIVVGIRVRSWSASESHPDVAFEPRVNFAKVPNIWEMQWV